MVTTVTMATTATRTSPIRTVRPLQELVSCIKDIIENRIEKNLKVVSKTWLVDLPENSSFTVSDFVAMQQSHIAGQSRLLQGKNMEIENAVTDLIQHIMTYQFETQNETVPEKDATKLRRVVPPPAESRVARHGEGVDPDPVGILIILASVPLGRFGFYGRRRRPRRRRCRSSLFRMFSSPSSLVRGRRCPHSPPPPHSSPPPLPPLPPPLLSAIALPLGPARSGCSSSSSDVSLVVVADC